MGRCRLVSCSLRASGGPDARVQVRVMMIMGFLSPSPERPGPDGLGLRCPRFPCRPSVWVSWRGGLLHGGGVLLPARAGGTAGTRRPGPRPRRRRRSDRIGQRRAPSSIGRSALEHLGAQSDHVQPTSAHIHQGCPASPRPQKVAGASIARLEGRLRPFSELRKAGPTVSLSSATCARRATPPPRRRWP